MLNLKELSIAELQSLIKDAEVELEYQQASQRQDIYVQIKSLAASVGAVVDISEVNKKKRKGAKVAPKFRNPNNPEQTWTGRGMKPRWVRDLVEAGHDQSEFLI